MRTTASPPASSSHAKASTRSAKPAAPTASAAKRNAKPDAITLLRADHAEVKALFQDYEKLAKGEAQAAQRQALALSICEMLKVHAQIEEEIFYPAARELLPEAELVDEATVEHAGAKNLIAQIEGMQANEPLFDAKVKVLGEQIDHHVKEEQNEMFPKLKKAGMDTQAVGAALAARKAELMPEH